MRKRCPYLFAVDDGLKRYVFEAGALGVVIGARQSYEPAAGGSP